jgi:hypothetical protein
MKLLLQNIIIIIIIHSIYNVKSFTSAMRDFFVTCITDFSFCSPNSWLIRTAPPTKYSGWLRDNVVSVYTTMH